MDNDKLQTLCVTGLVVLVVLFVGGLFATSTASYWRYHNKLLEEGKVLVTVPQQQEVKQVR